MGISARAPDFAKQLLVKYSSPGPHGRWTQACRSSRRQPRGSSILALTSGSLRSAVGAMEPQGSMSLRNVVDADGPADSPNGRNRFQPAVIAIPLQAQLAHRNPSRHATSRGQVLARQTVLAPPIPNVDPDVGNALLAHELHEPRDVLPPIKVAVDRDLLRVGTSKLVEPGKVIGMRESAGDQVPNDERRRKPARAAAPHHQDCPRCAELHKMLVGEQIGVTAKLLIIRHTEKLELSVLPAEVARASSP